MEERKERREGERRETAETTKPVQDSASSDYEIELDIPEYEVRRIVAARDPLAVVEAHRLNVCFRLAWLLGIRMCPKLPAVQRRTVGLPRFIRRKHATDRRHLRRCLGT